MTRFKRSLRDKNMWKYFVLEGALVFFVVGVLFFDTFVKWVTKPVVQPNEIIEKASRLSVAKITDAERLQIFGQARSLSDSGKFEDSLALLLKYLQRDPLNPEAYFHVGEAYLKLGDPRAAYDNLKQATKLRPEYFEAQEKLGEVFLIVGLNKEARNVAQLLSKDNRTRADGLILESEIAMAEGNLELAMGKAQTALAGTTRAPSLKSSAYLVSLYLKKGERAKAEDIINRIDRKSMNASDYVRLAKVYLGAGDEAKALPFFKEALRRYPENPEVNYVYGQYLFGKRNFRDAVLYYKKALNVMPNTRIISYRLSETLMASGLMKEARAQIDTMLEKNPNDPLAITIDAQHSFFTGDRKKTLAALNKIARIIPNAPKPFVLLSELYWLEGVMSLAQKNAQIALDLGDKSISPHMILGEVYTRRGQAAKALTHYEKALAIDPGNMTAVLQSGNLLVMLGQTKKAVEQFDKALSRFPNNVFLQNKVAMAKAVAGDPGQALTISRQNLTKNPDDLDAITAYVNALVINKRLDEAFSFIHQSIKKRPDNWMMSIILGDLYLLKGDTRAAGESYQQASKRIPDDMNALLNIAVRYEQIGLVKEADMLFINNQHKFGQNLLFANQLAWIYIEKLNTPQKAADLVGRLEREGEGANVKDTVGWYYCKIGDFNRAEYYLREALALDPEDLTIRGHLALTLFKLGKNTDAEIEAKKIGAALPKGMLKTEIEGFVAKKR